MDAVAAAARASQPPGDAMVTLRAPFAGAVAEVRSAPGQNVAADQPLLQLVDRSAVRVRFAAAEGLGGELGAKLQVAVDVAAPSEREGRIVEVRREGGRAVWEVELADPQGTLPLQLSPQSFRLIRRAVADACFVPAPAASCRAGRCGVWQRVAGLAQMRQAPLIEAVSDGFWLQWRPDPAGREAPLIVATERGAPSTLRAGEQVEPNVP